MPRQDRFNAPGTVLHVNVRGIEKLRIVNDVAGLKSFVKRKGKMKLPGDRVLHPRSYPKS